ncbi:FAD-dependent oxidoreductase [Ferruginibacter albus]|uniref:FAD-dependent oxidoreductase n=1 Tax=Ferruginibacter albus TaxID=2875540 RepID=UPI001CC5CDE8|nr:FAD-dependent oxidoreductase [Ferruginibacter albus]UAY52869.1 FAD-dependent oxidoreductase [Ferruginibacter albus]
MKKLNLKRDGAAESLWQYDQPAYKPHASKNKEEFDVIIAGGGITGVTTALLLQKSGLQCAILESNSLCFGTTGGTTAHLNTLLDTTYEQIASNFGKENAKLVADEVKKAIALIKNNIKQYSIDCDFKDASAFLFSQSEKQTEELKTIYKAAKEVDIEVAYADKIPVHIPFEKAIEVKGQAKFNPVHYVFALANEFEKAGGVIIENCCVHSVEQNEVVDIKTSTKDFKSTYFIYATHIPPGITFFNMRCAPYRSYAMAVLLNKNYPQNLCYDMYDPYHYYRTQEVNGQKFLIAGGEDHKTAHEENTEHCFLKLESHIRKYFDVKEIAFKWSSQYFEPNDGLSYIGNMPGNPGNILVATGFGGNGMVYSHVAAQLLHDIVLNKQNDAIALFNPNRIKPIAGFSNFIKENVDVIKKFAGKFFSSAEVQELSEIAKGEGKIIKYHDESIALYKDEQGKLYALNPICTHMKCNVEWNAVEKSWDCPCHGARYDINGKVLTGPADLDLEVVQITT